MKMNFVDVEPTLENYWRAIILFGKNTASYKFALAKSLIDISLESKSDLITLEDLALPYAMHLCEHLKHSPKQNNNDRNGAFLRACVDYNNHNITQEQLINITQKEGFKYVLNAFHIVNKNTIERQFYDVVDEEFFIDERKHNKGIRLTDNLFKLFYVHNHSSETLNNETEARWNLVEKAWELNVNRNLISVEFDNQTKQLFTSDKNNAHKRMTITSSRGALNGYQKSRCFYCFKEISIASKDSLLADVDHFFPHILKPDVSKAGCCRPVNVDGVWNLVLACQECNRGEKGKFEQVPTLELLERLNTRNEYLIASHHPLRETLILQTGRNPTQRKKFLQKSYNFSKERLVSNWQPKEQGLSRF